jgi:D-alanyl-D-alanine carboxypeptidase
MAKRSAAQPTAVERSAAESKPRPAAILASAAVVALALGLSACDGGARPVPLVTDSFTSPPPTVSVGAGTSAEAPPAETAPANPTPAPGGTTAQPAAAPSSAPAAPAVSGDPTSPLVVVNKRRPLAPIDFAPQLVAPNVVTASGQQELLNPVTAHAAEQMFSAATSDGAAMTLLSGYRSYATQAETYNGWVARQGQDAADVASARPGYSEHQTGFAFDIADHSGACSLQPCFKDTKAALWVAAHAHEYGFIIRYPWWHHETTGYYYEPWHLRYIGVETATDMHSRGIATLEDYLGLPAAPGY